MNTNFTKYIKTELPKTGQAMLTGFYGLDMGNEVSERSLLHERFWLTITIAQKCEDGLCLKIKWILLLCVP